MQLAVEAVVAELSPSVVQLRYFGGGDGLLGAAGAPVTGLLLEGSWVLTSTYGLDTAPERERPAGIVCRTPDGQQRRGQLVATDEGRGLALFRLDGAADAPPRLPASTIVSVGQTVVALGRVYSADTVSVNVGVVSAVGRLGGRAVQTDALVSPVNYGGPLVTLDGGLVGILAPLSPPGQRGVDLYDSGVGFAATAAEIEKVLPALAEGTNLRPGRLGVRLVAGDPLRSPADLLDVTPEGPAAAAGLEAGDVIVSLAGERSPTVWALRRIAHGLDAGQRVELVVRRGEEQKRRELTLSEAKPPSDGTLDKVLGLLPKHPEPTKKPGEP